MEKPIPLANFIDHSKKQLCAFMTYWIQHHEKDPARFPLTLLEGDWDEQFNAFCETQNVE